MADLSAGAIAVAVDPKARFSGGQWRARCPVHQGSSQNFYVRDGRDSVLLHCFRGCEFEELADNLRSRGLWPDKKKEEVFTTPTYTKDQLEYFHLYCLIYRDNVRSSYKPTPDEDEQFMLFQEVCHAEGIARGL
jgi:hypothetical protein